MSEIVIKLEISGLDPLVSVLGALVGKASINTNSVAEPQMQNPVSMQNPVPMQQVATQILSGQPGSQIPLSQPLGAPQQIQQQIPVQGQVPIIPQAPVPTTAVIQEYPQDQLAVAAAGLVNQGKQARLIEILNNFGVNSLVELGKERYGELATVLRSEGAVI